MENKYFTLDIEDIRVGYECEMRQRDVWEPYIVQDNDCLSDFRDMDGIRVSYITKEQIEAEGWEYTGFVHKYKGFIKKEHSDYWSARYKNAVMAYNPIDNTLVINVYDPTKTIDGEKPEYDYPNIKRGMFRGECKSINEFRKICKWLNIN